jgi:hypothetical protein
MLHDLDRKTWLARQVAEARGWDVALAGRLLVVADGATSRRRIERLGATFGVAFPDRGWAVRRWIANPSGTISGLLFLSHAPRGSTRRTGMARERVRRPETGSRASKVVSTAA